MGKKIANLLRLQAYPYLFGLFFLLHKTASYFSSFEISTFFLLLLAHFFLCSSISFFLTKIPGVKQYSLSLLLLLIMLFFSAKIINGIETNFPPIWIRNKYYPFGVICVFGMVLAIENSKRVRPLIKQLAPMMNTLVLIGSCLAIISGLIGNGYPRNTNGQVKADALQEKPDIVWILMDEYPNAKQLEKYFSFNNPIDTFLADKNFVILNHIQSRTSATVFSINAIFNNDDSTCDKSYLAAADQLKKCQWTKELAANGYKINCLDFLPVGNEKPFENVYMYPLNYFEQIIQETIFFTMLSAVKNNIDNYNNLILKATQDCIEKTTTQPTFIWSHLLIPHGPFFRDKNGLLLKDKAVNTQEISILKPRFLGYLEYGNNWLANLLNSYPTLKSKIVIISGDHSMRYSFIDKEDQTKPLCAIHMPFRYDTIALKKVKYISQLPGFIMQQLSKKQDYYQ